tara:strand:- start:6843 stop:7313 length:471 start_codon:yes stop_codon:yes gene_type:complete
MSDKPIYDKPRPKSLGKPKKLSSSQKSKAKSMAKKGGRPYPNMVDNIRAAKMEDGGCIPVMDARNRSQKYEEGGKVTSAWQRKEGKNPEGGLNEKGRKSYEKENPGSDLKAPQPKGGSRKKSFCARMTGMKKKLTSKKTANDPNSRINKALKKWEC